MDVFLNPFAVHSLRRTGFTSRNATEKYKDLIQDGNQNSSGLFFIRSFFIISFYIHSFFIPYFCIRSFFTRSFFIQFIFYTVNFL